MQTSDSCARKRCDRYSVVSSKLVSDVDEELFSGKDGSLSWARPEPPGVSRVGLLLTVGPSCPSCRPPPSLQHRGCSEPPTPNTEPLASLRPCPSCWFRTRLPRPQGLHAGGTVRCLSSVLEPLEPAAQAEGAVPSGHPAPAPSPDPDASCRAENTRVLKAAFSSRCRMTRLNITTPRGM